MKIQHKRTAIAAVMAAMCLAMFATASAQGPCAGKPCSGLWVGNVDLGFVSDANPVLADLGFDLGIHGKLVESYFIPEGATNWSYLATTSAAAVANFQLSNFNDTAWSVGTAPFGFSESNLATTVSPTSTVATFFRNEFVVTAASNYNLVSFRMQYDDGAVLYLNGTQIARQNMPTLFDVSTLALSAREGADETNFVTFTTPATLLKEGTNVVAVQVHQVQTTNNDMRFEMEMSASFTSENTLTLLPVQSDGWNYLDTGANLNGTNYSTAAYNDSAWKTNGIGPLGYGNGSEDITLIAPGPSTSRYVTTYFRRPFLVGGLAQQSHLDFLLRKDDGAVVYVNGAEVYRVNLPDGAINSSTEPLFPVGPDTEADYTVQRVSLKDMTVSAGTNFVGVEVHQHRAEWSSGSTTVPTPVAEPFEMRVLVHVDTNGTARFLKEVTQMWKDGTLKPDTNGSGNLVLDVPGQFVLVTDDEKIGDFEGIALRDGRRVGRRMSTIGFDFPSNHLDTAGTFSPSGSISFTNKIESDFRTNPFRHKFHPDHDNLDARYDETVEEAYAVTRAIEMDFQTRYPPSADPAAATESPPPGWGFSEIGGVYDEKIKGLHKNEINVIGSFSLKRVTIVDKLNDEN